MSIAYPFEQLPDPGTALEVAPGVRWLRMPLPFALDHINLWLLEDGSGWTAVDTGIARNEVKDCWRQLLPSYPLRRLIATHSHPDHLGLAGWLEQETGVPLWTTQGEYLTAHMICEQIDGYGIPAMLALFRQHGLDDARVAALGERGNAYQRNLSGIPATYRRLIDDQEIVIGGRIWRVIMGYGHSPEHAALYCDELKLLIAGDMLLPRITTNVSVVAANPDGNPLGLFLDSIARFKHLPQDTLVLPSHGKPFHGLHARITALEKHHAKHFDDLLAALDHPATAAELLPVLFSRPLTDAHQVMFAMGEAIAHLNYLEHVQRVRRTEENSIIRFVKSH
ncbi:MAG: MBL fold metallo-hydrolase [Betaproteobacteria bacterium]|nr:MBL fold metallo-hydrolase [Betaproteobacteria bacterium]